jgi:iron-sulfur cluster repair protein YtfE (RIC family)
MAQDAVTLLDEDHNEAIRLFERFKSARQGNTQELITSQLRQALLVHMQIEEEIFYPAYQKATGDNESLEDARKEHSEARELLARLDANRQDARLMLELEDAILHHVSDEREKMFPKARSAKGLDLDRLGEQLEARKTELMAGAGA